jgi:hypothetical protein
MNLGPQNNKMQRTSRGSFGGSPLILVLCGPTVLKSAALRRQRWQGGTRRIRRSSSHTCDSVSLKDKAR